MPNENNVEFVKDFTERTKTFNEFTAKCKKADEHHDRLQEVEGEINNLINKSVMASATSSLHKTSVTYKSSRYSYSGGENDYVITFNHKGMGTLYVGKGYGSTYSQEIYDNDSIEIVTNDKLCADIVSDLIKQNKMKILKTFNDVLNTKQHIIKIHDICTTYQNDKGREFPTYNLSKPIDVMVPIIVDDKLILSLMTIRQIRVEGNDSCILVQRIRKNKDDETSEDDIEDIKNKTHNRYPADTYTMSFDKIDSTMIYMQIPIELDMIVDSLNEQLEKDISVIDTEFSEIENKLSVYKLLSAVKNGE
jgi:hypothetical protein